MKIKRYTLSNHLHCLDFRFRFKKIVFEYNSKNKVFTLYYGNPIIKPILKL